MGQVGYFNQETENRSKQPAFFTTINDQYGRKTSIHF